MEGPTDKTAVDTSTREAETTPEVIEIECQSCRFSRNILVDDDGKAADVIIQHGRRSGHTMSVNVSEIRS